MVNRLGVNNDIGRMITPDKVMTSMKIATPASIIKFINRNEVRFVLKSELLKMIKACVMINITSNKIKVSR